MKEKTIGNHKPTIKSNSDDRIKSIVSLQNDDHNNIKTIKTD